jgi:hypothetical protein
MKQNGRAAYIELSSSSAAGAVEGNHLSSQQILAILNAAWNLNHLLSLIPYNDIGTPCPSIVTCALDFEPSFPLYQTGFLG